MAEAANVGMTIQQAGQILAMCARFDYREVDPLDVRQWHTLIGHLNYDDAEKAVYRYYRKETRRMMPADLIHGCIKPESEWMSQ
jgi:hypothetical protein